MTQDSQRIRYWLVLYRLRAGILLRRGITLCGHGLHGGKRLPRILLAAFRSLLDWQRDVAVPPLPGLSGNSYFYRVCSRAFLPVRVVVSGFPGPETAVGAATYTIPLGDSVVAATLSGTFGLTSEFVGSTAHHRLLLDGIVVGGTMDVSPDPCNNIVPFSFNVTDLSVLQDGQVTLSYIQDSEFVVRLSETTLTMTTRPTAAVPEPGSVALLAGMALSGVGLLRRRRK